MKLFSGFLSLYLIAACTSQESVNNQLSQQGQFIQDKCYNTSTYSLSESFDEFIHDRQQELNVLRPELTDENYDQLDFALKHFSTHWDELSSERDMACEQRATCEFFKTKNAKKQGYAQDVCESTDFKYNVSRAKIITFFNDIERLQLQRDE
ncbi:hypothetical protein [Photobacterium lipolyticum]|uniref:Uncharacterized protein n=1 Tax=Photobacterium lipolyticum TaxID=266810 RepID=A0A2T3MS68_9GAMM|nr:hypothetical protein [Photobacterium lipolyticum]PSW00120.1 hypothetical protein C9I89_21370 [Photobacterium lipolyticum]